MDLSHNPAMRTCAKILLDFIQLLFLAALVIGIVAVSGRKAHAQDTPEEPKKKFEHTYDRKEFRLSCEDKMLNSCLHLFQLIDQWGAETKRREAPPPEEKERVPGVMVYDRI